MLPGLRSKRLGVAASIGALALIGTLIGGAAAVSTATRADAAPGDAFDPNTALVFVAQSGGSTNTTLYQAVSNGAGATTFNQQGSAAPYTYNAMSYNTADNYLYAITGSAGAGVPANSLIRIGQDGVTSRVGTNTFPVAEAGQGNNVGVFGPDGYLYVMNGNTGSRMSVINVATGTLVRTLALSSTPVASDFTYANGYFWGMSNSTPDGAASRLVRVDPSSGAVITTSFTLPGNSYGAAWTYGNGNLGFSSNGTGVVYQVAVSDPSGTAPTATVVSSNPGPTSLGNDGAASPGAPADLSITKSVPASFIAGDTLTYTLTVTNNGAGNSSGYIVSDTMPAGLSNIASTTPGCTVSGQTVTCVGGALASGDTATITITGQTATTQVDCLTNTASVLGNEQDPVSENNTASATACPASYSVTKTADRTQVVPGQEITYTVTVTNTGEAAYTADAPASFSDDLSAVLDDATYNNDASGGATVAGNTLSWSGALAVGATQTITYSVTVNDPVTGDSQLDNTVVTPPGNGGDCDPDSGNPECTVNIPSGSYTVAKAASTATVTAGGTVTYTVTVTNTGNVAYTDAAPASLTDDLTSVLDDATYNGDASNGATVSGNTLSWSGPLAIGATQTITYSVTVNSPDTGDNLLKNTVRPTGDGGSCDPDGECSTTTQVRAFTLSKTSTPSGTVHPGDEVTYTVTVTSTGTAAFTTADPASFTDDLTQVLDDATITDGPDNGATITGNTLSWSGALAVGGTVTVTYVATVNTPDAGDKTLTNAAVAGGGGTCVTEGGCETTNLVGTYTVEKTSSATGPVHPGDTVTYTVTVTNTGAVAYTDAAPATLTDDLSKVLDDATYVDGSATNGAIVSVTTLTWSGPLEVGGVQTITYQVKAGPAGTGDGTLTNVVTADPDKGGGCATEGGCTTTNPLQSFSVTKTADQTEVTPGSTVTYTVTVTNTGAADYTEIDPASFTDSLSEVLDDATYNGDASNGATYDAPTLSWSGALAVGATETITYSVTVNDPATGDKQLDNTVVTPPGRGGDCDPNTDNAECTSNIPSGSYTVTKSADTATVAPGGKVTYTVTVTNTGNVAYTASKPAAFRDDLTNVLDDATYNGDATQGATVDGNTLAWSGALAVGQTVEVVYSVTVNDPDTGNKRLVNAVVPTQPGGGCDPEGSCMTNTPVGSYTVTKTVSTTDTVKPGAKVSYTVTVKNTGATDYTAAKPAKFTDNMSDVLDDATYNNDATHGATLQDTTLSWAGPLTVGETITITYSVTVKNPTTGNHRLINTVDPAVDGGGCDPAGSCQTTTPIGPNPAAPSGLASTGAEFVGPGIGLVLMLLTLGGGLLVVRRRQNGETQDNA